MRRISKLSQITKYILYMVLFLLGGLANAQQVVWSSVGYTDEAAIPQDVTYAYNGGTVRVQWDIVESGGGMAVLPGSTGSGGGGNDYLSYESSGQVGGQDNIIVVGFNNEANDPDDYIEIHYDFSVPQYGFKVTFLDIDTGSWDDGVEILVNGSINLKSKADWWAFENEGNSYVIEDDEAYFEGFEGEVGNAGAADNNGNLICTLSGVAVSSLRVKFFSTDDADPNPAGQKIGFTDLLIAKPDISTSSKTVSGDSGGEVDPGDVLTYTITINETSGNGAHASVVDVIPSGLENINIIQFPASGVNNSTSTQVQFDGIYIAGGGVETIVYEATVSASVLPGAVIENAMTITEVFGTTAIDSKSVTVSDPFVPPPVSGNKWLYLHTDPDKKTSRVVPVSNSNDRQLIKTGKSITWDLFPEIKKATVISSATPLQASLLIDRRDAAGTYSVQVELFHNATSVGSSIVYNYGSLVKNTPSVCNIDIPLNSDISLVVGDTISVRVYNRTAGGWNHRIRLYQLHNNLHSYISPFVETVINVDAMAFYDGAYPNGSTITETTPGDTVYIRTVVSDPFGAFDITSAEISLSGPGAISVSGLMIEKNASDALKTYEYEYQIPSGSAEGIWLATVTAHEGTEGTIDHSRGAAIDSIFLPDLMLVKTSYVISDPANGSNNPKRIPGAIIQYQIIVTNSGGSGGDPDSIVVSDSIPANSVMLVDDQYGGEGPVRFIPSTSGLTYTYVSLGDTTDDIEFINSGGSLITPSPNSDPNVQSIRFNPKGQLSGNSSFEFQFRIVIE